MIIKCGWIFGILLIGHVHSIMWYLEPNSQKCLKEEVQAQVSVVGEYLISEAPDQKVDCSVQDSNDHILYQKADPAQGKLVKFTFSTETPEVFEICFKSHVPHHVRGIKQEIMLVIKRGIEAKSYEGLGEAAKLKPVEVELKHLEDLSTTIVQDFARMKKNEEEMRDTNEATNSRVLYLSIFSICCLLGLSTWQVFYLRRFFRAKKLIE